MRYISNGEIEKLGISSNDMLEWAGDMIKHKSECVLPAKISMKQEGHIFYNVMPCILPKQKLAGVKLVNRYPMRAPSLKSNLMLYDLDSGDIKAVMDADFITKWRTAAVAVHSLKLFAKSDYKTVAFIGLGEIGKATLKVFFDTIDRDMTIRIFNYKNRADEIIGEYYVNNQKHNIKWEKYDDYLQMVKGCDVIVSSITYAEKDFADESVYEKGCLLIPVHTLGFQGCDLTFDKIFGDDKGHIEGFKYFDRFKSFAEVADVVNGKCSGRENDEERIIAYNIGIALHDIYYAGKICSLIETK